MARYRLVGNDQTGHEIVHIVYHIAVLIDVHGVLIKLKSAPNLAHLTSLNAQLVVEFPAGHHDIRSLGKVVSACICSLVQAMTEAIIEVVADVSFDFKAQLLVGKGRRPFFITVLLCPEARSIVEIHVERIVLLFQIRHFLGQRSVVSVASAHAGVGSVLCACRQTCGK